MLGHASAKMTLDVYGWLFEEDLEEFQSEIEAAGDEVSDELRSAWDSLRAQIEELMS